MTYEYLCTACGHGWEAEQSISAAPLTTCPSCHAESAKRQVSGGAGFILKGGGWYSDLYASASKKSGGDADSKTSGDSATKKEGSSDASTKGTDKGSSNSGSGSRDSGSGSSGSGGTGSSTPTSGTSSGSKAAGAPSGA